MKKLTVAIFVCIMATAMFSVVVSANNEITVTAHGERINFPDGQAPIVIEDRVFVPLRGVFETLGFNVFWNDTDYFATLVRATTFIRIPINSDNFSVTGGVSGNSATPIEYHALEMPARMIDDRVLVPIRQILEVVGYRLAWQDETRTVTITSEIGRAVSLTVSTDWTDNSTIINDARLAQMVANGEIPADVTHLVLSGHQINDVSPLSSLTNLVELHLVGNRIRDISPLSGLTNLRSLDLSFNQISDVAPLRNLTNLRELGLFDTRNGFEDISVLSNLTNLERFYLSADSQFNGDISVINNFTNLRRLGIWSANTKDYSPIGNLINLEAIDLSSAFHLQTLDILNNLINLTNFSLHGASIEDFSPLGRVTQLRHLSLQFVTFGNDGVRMLEHFTDLEFLMLIYTQITDISPLFSLTNLQFLMLDGNDIDERQMTQLRRALPNTFLVH